MQAEVSTLFGLNVYTEKGFYIGKIDDVMLEVSEKKVQGLAVTKLNKDMFDTSGKGTIIPYRLVTAVADIVLIRHVKDTFKKPEEVPEDYDISDEEET
ncbi:MAG: PRC-barrel domain-containing protein [Candidatus Methanoperedens sp.]|nr:PRC-barrel domain-containing protein [Candidatus Methanoperedens sp.]